MFKQQLGHRFKIKDLGELHWLLGIEVKQDCVACTISFSQHAYIDKILEKFGLHDAKPLSSLLDPHHTLTLSQSPATLCQYDDMCMVPYREAIGSLMYVALGMWPNITFSVSFLLQFMQNPGRPHWEVVKRVFRYLRGTRDYSLVIGSSGCLEWTGGSQDGLQGFCDADWASQEHCHSTSGYVFTIDGGAMSWSSKKQGIVALSTTEAEYVSLTHAMKETLWLRAFLAEIARPLRHPTTLFCDNQS